MRLFQAERLSVYVGDTFEIWGAPAASSPRVDPEAAVDGEVCRERILVGDDVVKARET